jgi:hypothetical protein
MARQGRWCHFADNLLDGARQPWRRIFDDRIVALLSRFSLLGFALAASAPDAFADPIQCPESATVSQSVADAPPAGWAPSVVDRPLVFSYVSIYYGDPVHEGAPSRAITCSIIVTQRMP